MSSKILSASFKMHDAVFVGGKDWKVLLFDCNYFWLRQLFTLDSYISSCFVDALAVLSSCLLCFFMKSRNLVSVLSMDSISNAWSCKSLNFLLD